MARSRPSDILLVEDNLGDVRLIQEVFKETKVHHNLHIVRDGVEAMDFLFRQGRYADANAPHLVLLDLKLPKKDGLEVLAEIKQHRLLRRIPVVILTTSHAEQDIIRSYDSYANAYILKPVNLDQFMKVMRSIEDFWLQIVRLAPRRIA